MSNLFISSIVFAIWSFILFFDKKVGLSAFLFVAPFTFYIIYLLDKKEKIKNKKAKWLMVPIIFLSLTYFLYDSLLKELNFCVILILLASMFMLLFDEEFYASRIVEKCMDIFIMPVANFGISIKETLKEVLKFNKKNIPSEKSQKAKKIIKAGICAMPLVFVIFCLLVSADTGFSDLFSSLFSGVFENIFDLLDQFQIFEILIRIGFIIISYLYILGFFKCILNSKDDGVVKSLENKVIKDNLTIKIILGSLNFLYLIFTIVQIKEVIDFNYDSNYAEFARKGFFQLMIVSLINLVTILVAKNRENPDEKNLYLKVMDLVMIFFTFTLIISAGLRMNFYENAYGYTHLRFLVYFALATESILLVPTIIYILDKKINLMKVYFVTITIMYIILNLINMDKFIAKKNIDRYFETGKIDFEYLKYNTGMDAIPEIIRLIDIKDKETRKLARGYIKTISDEFETKSFNFAEFNLSEYNAKKCIEKNYVEN